MKPPSLEAYYCFEKLKVSQKKPLRGLNQQKPHALSENCKTSEEVMTSVSWIKGLLLA